MLPDPVDGVETEKGVGISLQQIVCDDAITPGVTLFIVMVTTLLIALQTLPFKVLYVILR